MTVNKKRIFLAVLGITSGLILLQIISPLYKTYSSLRAQHAPGKMIDIGGYKLHAYCSGEGKPSVILDAGFSCFSIVWELVQPRIADFTHVCSYDRAGLGWSDTSPLLRTSANMVKELHLLLEKQETPKPYILVGHSFGGIIMQLYANTYPDEVFGLVLVDSSHELLIEKSAEFAKSSYQFLPYGQSYLHKFLYACNMEAFANFIGIRLHYMYSLVKNGIATIPTELRARFCARLFSIRALWTQAQEAQHIGESHRQLAQSRSSFADKPIIVISRGKAIDDKTDHKKMHLYLTHAHEAVWHTLQKNLAAKSSRAQHIIATQSGHTILWAEPELIIAAVKTLVDEYHLNNTNAHQAHILSSTAP